MIDLIQQKLKSYSPENRLEEENATKEILQEIALYALWRAKFFEVALFQGGTSLRILHGLPRFSENLDFMLIKPDPDFEWSSYLDSLVECFAEYGLMSEALPKGSMERSIRQAIIKDTSVANQLDLSFAGRNPKEKIKIKLEIDVNPPALSGEARTFLDFPLDHQVKHPDLASNFSLKIHDLLCRGFLKGRDWYDFAWYVSKGVLPNLPHLQAALIQYGPWAGTKDLLVDKDWLRGAVLEKISTLDWEEAKRDVRPFLRPQEALSLELWGFPFFNDKLTKLLKN
jgi:hypothetical protein